MTKVERLARYWAEAIKKNNPESSSVEVLKFALIALLNTTITVVLVLFITLLTGRIGAGFLAAFGFPALRYVSGGLHLKSANLCNILTAAFMLISVYMPIEYWYTGFVLNVLTIIVLLIYAPSSIKRSKLDTKKYPILKAIAISLVSTNFLFQSHVLAVVFLIQALTTTPLFQKLIDNIDSDLRG